MKKPSKSRDRTCFHCPAKFLREKHLQAKLSVASGGGRGTADTHNSDLKFKTKIKALASQDSISTDPWCLAKKKNGEEENRKGQFLVRGVKNMLVSIRDTERE